MITAQMVKELRDRTWVWMADCKNALVEANGDIELAIDILRKKWIAKAAKRAENETKEGKVKIINEWQVSYIVAVSCETDFVARNDTFDEMLNKFIEIRKAAKNDEEAIFVSDELKSTEYQLKMGENMRILALTKVEWEVIESYVHSNNKVAAIVVAKSGTNAEDLKQVAMHITATNPEVLSPSDISDEVVAKEKEIQLEIMSQDPKNAGKPAEILEKIIDGKMTKFKEENALLTQQFVINPDIKVKDFIGADNIVSFKRFAI
ncbi:MAG: Elongation factor Ts [uncultured bacterium (gcode 4)]|uniref:Elongation factor Ts n=1 Tax=uncultured bacterium (gcode 4) TaxID=1234023 RepID=K2FTG6_9BACT|nr:MAG: Elongation factor Ts [uncultured bacterium (gcode 4)]